MTEGIVAPASFAQERMWVMQQLEEGRPTYNVQIGLRFRGTLDTAALQRALSEVVRRQETLRTRLVRRDGELIQLVDPTGDVRLRTAGTGSTAGGHSAWTQVAERELHEPFDLGAEPPVRVVLVDAAPGDRVLLVTLDHLVCDAWSLKLLHAEIVALYTAFAAGEPSPLADPAIGYADFARWQRRWMAGDERGRQLGYWSRQLAGAPPRLRLYGQGERRAGVVTSRSRTHPIPDDLIAALDTLARGEASSLFAALLAGFAALMSRYALQDELVLGSLLAGRTRPEVEDLVGFFVNTVALRIDLGGAPTFRELVGRVRDTTLDAYTYQDLPFDEVVQAVQTKDTVRRTQPLFDVMFQLADVSRGDAAGPEVMIEALPMRDHPAPMDLVVAVVKEATGHTCVWDYRPDVFDQATVERMHEHYLRLLRAAVATPNRPVARLAITSAAERAWMLPATPAGNPGWRLDRHLRGLAVAAPDATALVADGVRLTYRQLDERTNRLARLLAERGAGPETPVGVYLDRGPDQVIAFVAILKAGGTYFPLDPDYPSARLRYMLTDAAPPLVVTTSGLAAGLPGEPGTTVIALDRIGAELAARPGTPLPERAGPDTAAYLIYTSGSTGEPKGTSVPHRGLGTIVAGLAGLGLGPDDRVLRFASASFDASILEMLMAFGAGAALHVAPPGIEALTGLTRFLETEQITAVMLVPSTLAAAVEDAELPALRIVAVGGEACPPALAARWAPGRRMFNLYGPTEATILSTCHEVTTPPDRTVPIGAALPGVAAYVVAADLQPVPPGMPGELYLGGPVLARGYRGRPALTATRFVADPFGPAGGRLYRTGDLVRWSAPGVLEFLGRSDAQVKMRGFRIELGEIEHVLAGCPGVRDAVAVMRPGSPEVTEIVGYVVPETGADLDPSALHSACAGALPRGLVPAHVVIIDDLPVNANGKIDRDALPAPRREAEPGETVASANPLEKAIAGIWSEVLGTTAIGSGDDFFDLGGNSLSATQVIIRLRDALELDLTITELFTHSALTEFTDAVRRAADADAG